MVVAAIHHCPTCDDGISADLGMQCRDCCPEAYGGELEFTVTQNDPPEGWDVESGVWAENPWPGPPSPSAGPIHGRPPPGPPVEVVKDGQLPQGALPASEGLKNAIIVIGILMLGLWPAAALARIAWAIVLSGWSWAGLW